MAITFILKHDTTLVFKVNLQSVFSSKWNKHYTRVWSKVTVDCVITVGFYLHIWFENVYAFPIKTIQDQFTASVNGLPQFIFKTEMLARSVMWPVIKVCFYGSGLPLL